MKKPYVFIFIGTTAEYIKLFTVIERLKERNIPFKVIASGQNEIIDTDIAKQVNLEIDLQLSYEKDIVKNAVGLFSWCFKTYLIAENKIIEAFGSKADFGNSIMLVHGDTISTVMGAYLGKKLGMRVMHVEAGLRSGNWFSPFPEEIDRRLISRISDVNFCQGDACMKNLEKAKGLNVNTIYNTVIDSLAYSEKISCVSEEVKKITNEDYCVFVFHRQENLMKPTLVKKIVHKAIEISKQRKVVFILHTITKNTLIKMDLLKKLEAEENIITFDRVEYFDFMKIAHSAKFFITDGGSNQEELSYLGKPALILRDSTERFEGLNGGNAALYKGDLNKIDEFVNEFEKYIRDRIIPQRFPSDIIADVIEKFLGDEYE